MKPFSLEEYLKNPSKRVVTRDGKEVRILCTDMKSDDNDTFPIVALYKDEQGIEWLNYYNKEGKICLNTNCNIDLFFAPKKKEGWINIWSCDDRIRCVGAEVFDSYEDAKNRDIIDRIATIKIEWEE